MDNLNSFFGHQRQSEGSSTEIDLQNNIQSIGKGLQNSETIPQNQFSQDNTGNNNLASLHKASIQHNEVTEEMRKTYEEIFNSYGIDAANNWLKEQIVSSHLNVQMDNEAIIKELQSKHADLYTIPVVREAIQAFIDMDLDPATSLRDQGFHHAMEHISNIYKAGYEDAMGLKAQNDSAKARMTSAVNSAVPHYQSSKIFTRAEIKAMSPEDFARNEKVIFEQLNKGLIK